MHIQLLKRISQQVNLSLIWGLNLGFIYLKKVLLLFQDYVIKNWMIWFSLTISVSTSTIFMIKCYKKNHLTFSLDEFTSYKVTFNNCSTYYDLLLFVKIKYKLDPFSTSLSFQIALNSYFCENFNT